MRFAPGPLAARFALIALLAVLGACGGTRSVSLADLAAEPERYAGDEVTTTGVVVEFDEDDGALQRHFVIQDDAAKRVKVLPEDAAEPHVGRVVRASGRFRFDESTGRVLEVEEIGPAGG
jgi:hypothetical protein